MIADGLRPYAEAHDLDTRLGRVLAIGYDVQGVRHMQVIVPVPGGDTVAVFGIATGQPAEWEASTLHLVNMVGTVRLT